MSGKMAMHNDNISKLNFMSKLDEFLNTVCSSAFIENDVVSMIHMCKDHLQKYHGVANIDLLKVNSETKENVK